jgi:citrate lyase subunit alpha/citrate CoA-transferase
LIDKAKDAGVPVKSIEELKEEAEKICGKPAKPELDDEIVAVVKWVDGTVMDAVRKVRTE